MSGTAIYSLTVLSAGLAVLTGVGILLITVASRRDIKAVASSGATKKSESFSAICSIRSESGILDRVEQALAVPGIDQFVLTDDTPDGREGVRTYFDGEFVWHRRQNVTSANRKHVSLNLALDEAEYNSLVVMDIDTNFCDDTLVRNYMGQPFLVGKVLPDSWNTVFGLYEKIDADVRQRVMQPGRYNLEFCPNLPGCFYISRKDVLDEMGYTSEYEDFVLTLDLYENGFQVDFVDEVAAYQHVPDSLSGVAERRTRWFSHFISNCPEIFRRTFSFPTIRTTVGILLYPFIWYFAGYALVVCLALSVVTGIYAPFLVGTGVFLSSYWVAAFVSQRSQCGLVRSGARATFFVATYALSLAFIPVGAGVRKVLP